MAGVAVTATFSQQAFAKSLALDFPLLSDWDREVCAAYGVQHDVWKGHAGLAKRAVFVIDARGAIRFSWAPDDSLLLPDVDQVVDAVREVVTAG